MDVLPWNESWVDVANKNETTYIIWDLLNTEKEEYFAQLKDLDTINIVKHNMFGVQLYDTWSKCIISLE